VDDDAGFETAVAPRVGAVPHVHPHASGLAVWGCGEVGVVQAGAVLGVEDGEVVSDAAGAVVVDFKVAGFLVEAEGVKKVVVGVCSVEELRDRSICVAFPVALLKGIRILEVQAGVRRTGLVDIIGSVLVVGLGNAVVTPGGLERF
jgi:hypothetical protein